MGSMNPPERPMPGSRGLGPTEPGAFWNNGFLTSGVVAQLHRFGSGAMAVARCATDGVGSG